MADDMGEKTEDPTPRKIEDARERGQVAKSTDLSAAIDLLGGALLLTIFGAALARASIEVMRRGLDGLNGTLTPSQVGAVIREALLGPAVAMAPILVLLVPVVIIGHFVQYGPLFTTDALMPKLERLDPIKGLGNLLSRKNLVKGLLNIIKLGIVIWVGWTYMSSAIDQVSSLPVLQVREAFAMIGMLCLKLLAWLLALFLFLGVADYMFQRWQLMQDLRMTKQEVQDERRSMEGDPLVKGRRMQLMRQIALQQMNQTVPKADVIVTNPTHFSVAIQYDETTMAAPRVVAKGVDFMAMRIRQVAMVHQVPIVERPPLARALYYEVEVGGQVPAEMYQAIAELLAYVYRLEREAA